MMQGGLAARAWEYKVLVPRDRTPREDELNRLGDQGWEVCAGDGSLLIFKRPKPPTPPAGGRFGGAVAGSPDGPPGFPGGFGAPGGGNTGATDSGPAGGGRGSGGTGTTTGGPPQGLTGGMFGGFGAAPTGRPGGRAEEVQILTLKNATAKDLATLLKEVYGRTSGVALTADPRTNSLIVAGDKTLLDTIKALVERLDQPAADTAPRRKTP
jgi:hypothetical protein